MSRCWSGISVSGLLGVTFVQDARQWQSVRRRAGNAETLLRPPMTTQWRLVGRGGATGRVGGLEPPPVGEGLPPVGEFKDFSLGWVGYDFH